MMKKLFFTLTLLLFVGAFSNPTFASSSETTIELKKDDKKEKKAHEKDAIKDDKKQIKDLKKDEKEDKKALRKDNK